MEENKRDNTPMFFRVLKEWYCQGRMIRYDVNDEWRCYDDSVSLCCCSNIVNKIMICIILKPYRFRSFRSSSEVTKLYNEHNIHGWYTVVVVLLFCSYSQLHTYSVEFHKCVQSYSHVYHSHQSGVINMWWQS